MSRDKGLDGLFVRTPVRLEHARNTNGTQRRPDFARPRNEVKVERSVHKWVVEGQGEELAVKVDQARERCVGKGELIGKAHVVCQAQDLRGGLEGVGPFLPEETLIISLGDDVAAHLLARLGDEHAVDTVLLEQMEAEG